MGAAENTSPIQVMKAGTVVSAKMNKTIVVEVVRVYQHPLYRKTVRSCKKYKAHDAKNTCREGDVVEIRQTRPISKTKCWELNKVVTRGVRV